MDFSWCISDGRWTNEDPSTGEDLDRVGDIDGDGLDDLLIGGGTAVWLFTSQPSGEVDIDDAEYIYYREDWPEYHDGEYEDYDQEGEVAGAGDLDGDGLEEFLISHSNWDPVHDTDLRENYQGIVFVVNDPMPGLQSIEDLDVALVGEDHSETGRFVNGAGDLNADGYSDVLVSSEPEGAGCWGWLLLYGPISTSRDIACADATFNRSFPGAYAKFTGDVDADGFDDMAVGLNLWDVAGEYSGGAALLYGPIEGVRSFEDADVLFMGETEGDFSGGPTVGAGDMNADGFADLLLGASGLDDEEGNATGGAWIIYGGAW